VSFDVQPGDVVGIVGRNGAGKSTLLKILSRIVEPTDGRAEVRGRIGSLLEVGTGFHPELTGRENIYLNGSILGMKRREIDRRFDEIVAFSETEQFLDSPVKRYSSGMYVRLAFAVAAHLEPEILVIDEVLAVGDGQFQRKCLGKMNEVAKQGRTVLFVSHNMAAVQNLCNKGILIEKGVLKEFGSIRHVFDSYLHVQTAASTTALTHFGNRVGNREVLFTYFDVRNDKNEPISVVQSGQDVVFAFGFDCSKPIAKKNVNVGFGIHGSTGERLTVLYASHTGDEFEALPESGEFHCKVARFPFNPGRYFMLPRIQVNGLESDFPLDGVGYFDVEGGDFYRTGRQTLDRSYSPFLIDGRWTLASDCDVRGRRECRI
jgi:lipopolysaccharide transport system ATP-binding protein